MDEFRWIIMSSFLMLVLKFTAAAGQHPSFTVRGGDEVTLPCETVKDDQDKCNGTWFVDDSDKAVMLFEHGQILKDAKNRSDRVSVTANCSLVIKKVTVEDAGFYTCRQFKSGSYQDSQVYLFVINTTEHKDTDKVTLNCSVSNPRWCRHTVKWQYEVKNMAEDNKNMKTSQSDCSATVTFLPSFLKQTSKQHELFQCNVTNIYNENVKPLTSRLQSSGDGATMTTTTRNKWTPAKMNTSEETNNAESTNNNNQTKQGSWWWFIIVFVSFVVLLINAVAVITWRRTKGRKMQMDENVGLSFNTAVTQSGPETSQDTADPEGGVSYASISYIKKTNSEARVQGDDDDDDEGDAVTYSTVKASSSSAGASADPSSLYATIN